MASTRDRFLAFIRQAGETFGAEEFEQMDLDLESEPAPDAEAPNFCVDLVREETNEVYRFCLVSEPITGAESLRDHFELFRELEEDAEDEYEGAVLLVKSEADGDDFWYIQRVDSGEVGLFHSELSFADLDLMDDDEDDEEDDDLADDDDDEDEDDKEKGKD